MKTRNGFVSNSSSSSFVVMLPKDLDFPTLLASAGVSEDLEEMAAYEYDVSIEDSTQKVIDAYNRLLQSKVVWDEEVGQDVGELLKKALAPFVIASIDTSSDAGRISLVGNEEKEKIRNILNME